MFYLSLQNHPFYCVAHFTVRRQRVSLRHDDVKPLGVQFCLNEFTRMRQARKTRISGRARARFSPGEALFEWRERPARQPQMKLTGGAASKGPRI
jgi:hypothetical protein